MPLPLWACSWHQQPLNHTGLIQKYLSIWCNFYWNVLDVLEGTRVAHQHIQADSEDESLNDFSWRHWWGDSLNWRQNRTRGLLHSSTIMCLTIYETSDFIFHNRQPPSFGLLGQCCYWHIFGTGVLFLLVLLVTYWEPSRVLTFLFFEKSVTTLLGLERRCSKHMLHIRHKVWAWRDGSGMKSAHCSHCGPKWEFLVPISGNSQAPITLPITDQINTFVSRGPTLTCTYLHSRAQLCHIQADFISLRYTTSISTI